MRRWSLIVVLTATLVLGASACGLKESDDAGNLAAEFDSTTEPGAAGPATTGDPAADDTIADPSADDPFGEDGSSGEGSDEDPSSDDGSGENGSGDSGSGDGDFCSLANESTEALSSGASADYLESWLASAPEELRDEVEIVTDWYEQSASDPTAGMPDEVLNALIAISQYTIENCT